MSVVYLVRHGQASFGAADYDVLSPTGEQQAQVVGALLAERGVRPERAICGGLSRQRRTAELLLAAGGYDLPVETDPRWDEYDHIGMVGELDAPPTPRDFQRLLDQALLGWVGGEPAGFAEFSAGANAALDGLAGGGTTLVVTSGGVIAAIAARLLGVPAPGFVALNRVMVNASITKVAHGRSGVSLLSCNEHGHFEGNRHLLTYR